MKTRQEMIYEFMVALASNPNVCKQEVSVNMHSHNKDIADTVAQLASALVNEFLDEGR
jgi:hypothetical protein